MKQYLRAYINYLQDDWSHWLAMAEFVENNTKFETIKLTFFFANKGFHSPMSFELIELTNVNANKLNANTFANQIQKI